MKKLLLIFIGSLLFLIIGIFVTVTLSDWLAHNFIHSDDDMNSFGKLIFFGVYPSLLVVGGFFGFWFYQKKQKVNKYQKNYFLTRLFNLLHH